MADWADHTIAVPRPLRSIGLFSAWDYLATARRPGLFGHGHRHRDEELNCDWFQA